MAIGFTLDLYHFQLADFAENASFGSYSSFSTCQFMYLGVGGVSLHKVVVVIGVLSERSNCAN